MSIQENRRVTCELAKDWEEGREVSAERLLDYFIDNGFVTYPMREDLDNLLRHLSPEKRLSIVKELQKLALEISRSRSASFFEEVVKLLEEGVDIVEAQFSFGRERLPASYRTPQPENIRSIFDFRGTVSERQDWVVSWMIPRRIDIQRYLKAAEIVHQQSGRGGPIRVVNVGDGTGFLSKLIADEAERQGLVVEIFSVDPDSSSQQSGQRAYGKTRGLNFVNGSSQEAVKVFAPSLVPKQSETFSSLEITWQKLANLAKRELGYLEAILASLESGRSLSEIKKGSLAKAVMSFESHPDWPNVMSASTEEVLRQVAVFYQKRFAEKQAELRQIRDQQEELFFEQRGEGQVDVVINAWMPKGFDFTRDLRKLSAPIIIYARDWSRHMEDEEGATGNNFEPSLPYEIGLERSYQTGYHYRQDRSLIWRSFSADDVRFLRRTGDTVDYPHNFSIIQVREDIALSAADLPTILSDRRLEYPWEKSFPPSDRDRLDRDLLYGLDN